MHIFIQIAWQLMFFSLALSARTHPESVRAQTPRPDARYVFTAAEEWDRSAFTPHLPSDAIPDRAYRRASATETFHVRVYDSGHRVEIVGGAQRYEGHVDSANGRPDHFVLEQGAFAGGRFVIEHQGTALRGELTLYGSGIPIVNSHRGPVVAE